MFDWALNTLLAGCSANSNSNKNVLNKHLKIFMENILRVAPDNYFKKCQEQKQPPEVLCKKRRS